MNDLSEKLLKFHLMCLLQSMFAMKKIIYIPPNKLKYCFWIQTSRTLRVEKKT
ncbi:hypothetical protein RHMOL_Rhmol05G0217300 [Rhododendron molle]|uniref:Uncharacterized protein n=1 Tax=Rhododendron molle TaxID=49168 RepID=A0ACC0NRT2_RHOML|nr:hypothetical protein RHMOL_Rhmol05G0217300 [Rhododendron molle]